MTTHERHPEMIDTTPEVSQGQMGQSQMDRDQMDPGRMNHGMAPTSEAAFSESTDAPATLDEPTREPVAQEPTAGGTDQTLFGDNDLSGFRSRWTEVQAAFVDDPRDCVQKADSLVSDVVDQLTAGFARARSGLEEQWSRGEQVSTEDLRLALQRYRDFFERLLAV